jgi:hypothetical protein
MGGGGWLSCRVIAGVGEIGVDGVRDDRGLPGWRMNRGLRGFARIGGMMGGGSSDYRGITVLTVLGEQ